MAACRAHNLFESARGCWPELYQEPAGRISIEKSKVESPKSKIILVPSLDLGRARHASPLRTLDFGPPCSRPSLSRPIPANM